MVILQYSNSEVPVWQMSNNDYFDHNINNKNSLIDCVCQLFVSFGLSVLSNDGGDW